MTAIMGRANDTGGFSYITSSNPFTFDIITIHVLHWVLIWLSVCIRDKYRFRWQKSQWKQGWGIALVRRINFKFSKRECCRHPSHAILYSLLYSKKKTIYRVQCKIYLLLLFPLISCGPGIHPILPKPITVGAISI